MTLPKPGVLVPGVSRDGFSGGHPVEGEQDGEQDHSSRLQSGDKAEGGVAIHSRVFLVLFKKVTCPVYACRVAYTGQVTCTMYQKNTVMFILSSCSSPCIIDIDKTRISRIRAECTMECFEPRCSQGHRVPCYHNNKESMFLWSGCICRVLA